MFFRGGAREPSEASPEPGFNSREADLREPFCAVTTEEDEPPDENVGCRFFLTALVNRSVIGSLLGSGLVSLLRSFGSPDITRPPPLLFSMSMSGVLLNMSFAGEAGGEIKLSGGTVRVSGSASLLCRHGGVDTRLSTMGGGEAESALDAFNTGDWESNVGPSVKPDVLGEV